MGQRHLAEGWWAWHWGHPPVSPYIPRRLLVLLVPQAVPPCDKPVWSAWRLQARRS